MQTPTQNTETVRDFLPPLPPMSLTAPQRHLLVALRVFLALLSLLALYDFVASLS